MKKQAATQSNKYSNLPTKELRALEQIVLESKEELHKLDRKNNKNVKNKIHISSLWSIMLGTMAFLEMTCLLLIPTFVKVDPKLEECIYNAAMKDIELKRKGSISATLLHIWGRYFSSSRNDNNVTRIEYYNYGGGDYNDESCSSSSSAYYGSLLLLKHRTAITWIFCTLWIIEGFIRVYQMYKQNHRCQTGGGNETSNKQQQLVQKSPSTQKSVIQLIFFQRREQHDIPKPKVQASASTTSTISAMLILTFFYLSLVPVGYYIMSFHQHCSILTHQDPDPSYRIIENEILTLVISDSTSTSTTTNFTTTTLLNYTEKRYSILSQQIIKWFLHFTNIILQKSQPYIDEIIRPLIKYQALRTTKLLSKRVAIYAIYNPRLFRARIVQFLRLINWMIYLTPLAYPLMRVFYTIPLVLKRRQQYKQARLAKTIFQNHWKSLSYNDKRSEAAKRIQKVYRSYVSHRKNILKVQRQIQMVLKRRARRARLIVEKKKMEIKKQLDCMKKNEELSLLNTGAAYVGSDSTITFATDTGRSCVSRMKQERCDNASTAKEKNDSPNDEKRTTTESIVMTQRQQVKEQIEELQFELHEAYEEKKPMRMLLRPNTKFSFYWKTIFVICVSIEFIQKAFGPYLTKVLNEQIVKRTDGQQQESFLFYIGGGSGGAHVTGCITFVIGIICFLDVFVTFYTGQIQESTGLLQPKPFVKRWVFPGILFQLLVNPKMADLTLFVQELIRSCHAVGPARVVRWYVVLFLPVTRMVQFWLEQNVWMNFVERENRQAQS